MIITLTATHCQSKTIVKATTTPQYTHVHDKKYKGPITPRIGCSRVTTY
jgi:hypothetical protein